LRRLREAAGLRTVPVEVCDAEGGYAGRGFGVEMVPFAEFLEGCVDGGGGGGGGGGALRYLAQHDLFSQVPALRCDVAVPDYACEGGLGDEPLLQAWLGPMGTVSNLHWDRARNILVQVAGAKWFRLFPPAAGPALHAAPPPLGNTSALPVEALRDPVPGSCGAGGAKWARDFPLYAAGGAGAPLEGTLLPGDALYIPPGWWHALEALTPSFSVSCWW
jgi:lysine-specific demethylase 8